MKDPRIAEALEQLRDPLRLRIAVCIGTLLIGYLALYTPLDTSIQDATRQLRDVKRMNAVLQDVHFMQEQEQLLATRIGGKDTGVCVQHVVDGVRGLGVKVLRFEPQPTKKLGPFESACFQLDVEGSVDELDSLLHWIDTNQLLFRVESFRMSPGKDEQSLPTLSVRFLLLKEKA